MSAPTKEQLVSLGIKLVPVVFSALGEALAVLAGGQSVDAAAERFISSVADQRAEQKFPNLEVEK